MFTFWCAHLGRSNETAWLEKNKAALPGRLFRFAKVTTSRRSHVLLPEPRGPNKKNDASGKLTKRL